MEQADIEDGRRPGLTDADRVELREAKKRIRLLERENEVLRRAAAYLSQANLPGNTLPAVREMAATGAPIRVPVPVACRVLALSPRGTTSGSHNRSVSGTGTTPISSTSPTSSMATMRRWATGSSPTGSTLSTASRPARTASIGSAGSQASPRRTHKKRSKAGSTGPAPHDDLLAVVDEHGVVRHEFIADARTRSGCGTSRRRPSGCSRTTTSSARWVVPTEPATTPARRASSHCCRRTRSTPGAGTPARTSASRWSPGFATKYSRRRRQRALGKLTPVEFEMIYTAAESALTTANPECQPDRGQTRADWVNQLRPRAFAAPQLMMKSRRAFS